MDEAVCWRAVESRDPQPAGHFFYGVLTTGVFCRPGCSSRTPNRENVRFFSTASEAEALGYRPCKRCRPDRLESEAAHKIATVCRRMEAGEEKTLDEWAAETGWSPAHLQKTFKASVGLSPAQYARQLKLGRLKRTLRSSATVTEAMHEAGYSSTSRLHEQSLRGLAMKPSDYLHGGRGLVLHYASVDSPAGQALVAWTDRGVCFAEFGQSTSDSLSRLRAEFPRAELSQAQLSDWDAALAVLEGPIDAGGTVFQQMVWSYLRTIPPGETRSYSHTSSPG
jgi:AraC family transcriptional regulator of adaptative response/methylated-DNA-[protein]-cysteine methyltransferase